MCYEDQFGIAIQAGATVGVHLEHLVSCIQGIHLVTAPGGYKHLKWQENKLDDLQNGLLEDFRRSSSMGTAIFNHLFMVGSQLVKRGYNLSLRVRGLHIGDRVFYGSILPFLFRDF
jgi:hypothetical protein